MSDEVDAAVAQAKRDGLHAAGERLPTVRSWWRRPSSWMALVGVLAIVLLGATAVVAIDRSSAAVDKASAASRAADANGAGLAEANGRIRSLGGTPVPTPTTSAQPGAAGPRGPSPTTSQIQAAVAVYCDFRSGCAGTPSRAQVTAAVRAYCSTGVCKGSAGASGSPGAPGATGSPGASGQPGVAGQPGATGASPSASDIAIAVTAYCAAHGDCTGAAGPKGDTGAQGDRGAAGRGIASIDCSGLGVDRLHISYDDGTSQDVLCGLDAPTDASTPTP